MHSGKSSPYRTRLPTKYIAFFYSSFFFPAAAAAATAASVV
jgi:hypothetical protein